MWSLGEGRALIDGAKADGGGGRSGKGWKGQCEKRAHESMCRGHNPFRGAGAVASQGELVSGAPRVKRVVFRNNA